MSSDEDEPPKKKLKGGDTLPECPYGAKCYRKNPEHFKEFSHSDKKTTDDKKTTVDKKTTDVKKTKASAVDASTSSDADDSNLPPCKYGVNCYRKNLLHFAEYWHPFKGAADDDNSGGEAEDSGGDTDTDIQQLEDDNTKSKQVKSKTDFLKRGTSLFKSFTKMTEEERKELIKQALEAKQHLQSKLKESNDKIEQQSKELERLQQEVNTGTLLMEGEENVLKGKQMRAYPLVAERAYKEGSAAQVHFRLAESQFYRLVSGQGGAYRVTKVEYMVNPELVKRFKQAREDMKKFRGNDMSYPVLAFHGTQEKNIDLICQSGFRSPGESGFKHRTDTGWYGKGVYFSEFPTYSMGYIQGATKLLLCQVLLGKVFQCTTLIHGQALKSGSDSHTSPDKKELVIFNSHHILPCYVVHYENSSQEFKYIENKATVKKKAKKTKAQMTAACQKAMKAKKSKVFEGQGFTLLGKLSDTQANLENLLMKHCGYSESKLSPGGLIPIVASEASLKAAATTAILKKARNTNMPILREDYIYDCILEKKVLDRDPYLLE